MMNCKNSHAYSERAIGEKIENILKNNMQTITDWLEMANE